MSSISVPIRETIIPAPTPHAIANEFMKAGINIVVNMTSPKLKIDLRFPEFY